MKRIIKVVILLTLVLLTLKAESREAARTILSLPTGTTTVTVGGDINGIAVDPTSGSILLSDFMSNKVIFYLGKTGGEIFTMAKNIPTGSSDMTYIHNPLAVAFDSSTNKFFVANSNAPDTSVTMTIAPLITVINNIGGTVPSMNLDNLSLGSNAIFSGIAIDPDNHIAFFSDYNNNKIIRLKTDTLTIERDISPAGGTPAGLAYDPTTGFLYVANSLDKLITIIETQLEGGSPDATSTRQPIKLSFEPHGIGVNPSTGSVFVGKRSNSFEILTLNDDDSTYSSINPIVESGTVAIDDVNDRAFIVNNTQGTLTVIDTVTNKIKNVYAVDSARSVAYNPTTNKVFVGTSDGKLFVISATGRF